MGIFFKALGALVVADAIDRSARRPQRYWYPDRPGLPRTGTTQPWTPSGAPLAPAGWYPDPAGQGELRWWDGQRWSAPHSAPPDRLAAPS